MPRKIKQKIKLALSLAVEEAGENMVNQVDEVVWIINPDLMVPFTAPNAAGDGEGVLDIILPPETIAEDDDNGIVMVCATRYCLAKLFVTGTRNTKAWERKVCGSGGGVGSSPGRV